MTDKTPSTNDPDFMRIKIPREVKIWRGFVTLALAFIGAGQYIGPGTLHKIEENVQELRREMSVLTSQTSSQNEQLDRITRDHEIRLRDLERSRLKP